MDEGAIGLAVFLVTGVISALAWHTFVRRFWVAVFAASATTFAIFHTFAMLFPSAPNKFYAVAVVFSAIYAVGMSFVGGVPFWYMRRRGKSGNAL